MFNLTGGIKVTYLEDGLTRTLRSHQVKGLPDKAISIVPTVSTKPVSTVESVDSPDQATSAQPMTSNEGVDCAESYAGKICATATCIVWLELRVTNVNNNFDSQLFVTYIRPNFFVFFNGWRTTKQPAPQTRV